MRVLFLGGGRCQENGIRRLKALGHEVILTDYYEHPHAEELADAHVQISTFDLEANLIVARDKSVSAVMTMGTDQPVRTMAHVAERLDLPTPIDPETAYLVTNKRAMKMRFVDAGLPTAPFLFVDRQTRPDEIPFPLPWVVKPLDAQGQRGVYRIDRPQELSTAIDDSFRFTRENQLLLEGYYPSREVTVTGWVSGGETHVFTITDRVTTENGRSIGICTEHLYPSRAARGIENEIRSLADQITRAFVIQEGPIYYQMLLGERGPVINEIACRLGGAYEDVFVPLVTGVDLLGLLIASHLDGEVEIPEHTQEDTRFSHLSVQLLFARPGRVTELLHETVPGEVVSEWFVSPGDQIEPFDNATYRVGYAIIGATSQAELEQRIGMFFERNRVLEGRENLLVEGRKGK